MGGSAYTLCGDAQALAGERLRKRLQIGFVTALNPMDRRSWSGTFYFMAKALQKHCGDVHCLGPVGTLPRRAGEALWAASWLLLRKNYLYTHSPWLARTYAALLKRKIDRIQLDFLFAAAAAPEIAFLDVSIPIVYSADSTFAVVKDYYPRFTDVLGLSVRQAHHIDGMGARKAALLAYPSEWAAQSAVRDYHVEESRVHVIPYGANLEDPPAREDALRSRTSDECRLLFVGVKWERKGGPIAVETLVKLRAMGIAAQLTVCGCVPPREFQTPGLTVIPFLNKNDPAQRQKLEDLYLASHFLLLPSRSECYGIAFCEANAFGLPVVTTRTGGIPEVVREGRNGFMLPLSAGGPEYAELIARIWGDRSGYSELTRSSRQEFEERLNWDAWATSVGRLLPRVLPRRNTLNDEPS